MLPMVISSPTSSPRDSLTFLPLTTVPALVEDLFSSRTSPASQETLQWIRETLHDVYVQTTLLHRLPEDRADTENWRGHWQAKSKCRARFDKDTGYITQAVTELKKELRRVLNAE